MCREHITEGDRKVGERKDKKNGMKFENLYCSVILLGTYKA
jgi:hypothetical protein